MTRKIVTASDREALIRLASGLPSDSDERRAILAGLKGVKAGRDPHEEARRLVDNWEGGLEPLFMAVRDLQRSLKEAKATVDNLDRKGMGGTIASPHYLKGAIFPLEAIANLAERSAKHIRKIVKDAGVDV